MCLVEEMKRFGAPETRAPATDSFSFDYSYSIISNRPETLKSWMNFQQLEEDLGLIVQFRYSLASDPKHRVSALSIERVDDVQNTEI